MEHSSSLRYLQQWMQHQLIKPEGKADPSEVESYIRAGDQLSPRECLGIYQTSYELRLVECMRKKFTALFITLGPALFDEFSRMYLHAFPSNSPSLTELGNDFPAWLENTRPDREEKEQWIDFMIAMAQFEIDMYRIFDQEGSESMTFADQATPDDHLLVQKAFGLCQYAFDVHRYYRQISKGEDASLGDVSLTYLAFVRRQYHVYVVELDELQFQFLSKLEKLNNISATIESCSGDWKKDIKDIDKLWNTWKAHWIKEGFFILKS